jgi:hypothetical protein
MRKQKGYIALASILVISVVIVVIGTSVALLSINEIQSSLSNKKSEQGLGFVDSCVEEALLRLNEEIAIPALLTLPEGTCTATVNSQTGANWTFTVNGTSEGYSKTVRVSVIRRQIVDIVSRVEM